MLWADHEAGDLELRRAKSGEKRLRGRFKYGKRAVLSDGGRNGGRPKKEIIAPNAFEYRINKPDEDIHFLVGHSYDRPLASRSAGTLDIRNTSDEVIFDALISQELQEVSYVFDFLRAFDAGLIIGLSPGFRLPPPRRVPNPETIEDEGFDEENGAFNAIIRTVLSALLFEMSAVTRPAYTDATQIEERNWQADDNSIIRENHARSIKRWRA